MSTAESDSRWHTHQIPNHRRNHRTAPNPAPRTPAAPATGNGTRTWPPATHRRSGGPRPLDGCRATSTHRPPRRHQSRMDTSSPRPNSDWCKSQARRSTPNRTDHRPLGHLGDKDRLTAPPHPTPQPPPPRQRTRQAAPPSPPKNPPARSSEDLSLTKNISFTHIKYMDARPERRERRYQPCLRPAVKNKAIRRPQRRSTPRHQARQQWRGC